MAPGGGLPGGQWQGIDACLQASGITIGAPTAEQTTQGGHASGSLHYQGRARDYGTVGSDPWAIYNKLAPIAADPNGPIEELFWDPSGTGWKNGRNIGPIGGHSNHVHVGVKPGRSICDSTVGMNAPNAPKTQPGVAPLPDPQAELQAQMDGSDKVLAERAKNMQQGPNAANPTPDRPVAAGGTTPPVNTPAAAGTTTPPGELGVMQAPVATAGGQAAIPKGLTAAGSFPAPVTTTATGQPAPPPVAVPVAPPAAAGSGPTSEISAHIGAVMSQIMGTPPPSEANQPRGNTPTKPAVGPATPHGNTVDEWITAALARTGKPESWREPLRRIIMRESSGNPTAVNNWDSNAKRGDPSRGLMQLTISNWNTYGQGGNWADPVDDIVGGIRYIDGRYGGDITKTLGRSY